MNKTWMEDHFINNFSQHTVVESSWFSQAPGQNELKVKLVLGATIERLYDLSRPHKSSLGKQWGEFRGKHIGGSTYLYEDLGYLHVSMPYSTVQGCPSYNTTNPGLITPFAA